MRAVIITERDAGQRFDKYLRKYMPQAGSGFLYKMLRKKNIVLNDKKADGRELLAAGDEIKLYLAEDTIDKFRGLTADLQTASLAASGYPQMPLEILYEDTNYLVVNKPAGVLSQKAKESDISMVEYLIGYLLAEQALKPEDLSVFHPGVCNRLDRNTSGILLAGKTMKGLQDFSYLLKERSVKKYYLCLVKGEIRHASHQTAWLWKNGRTNQVKILSEETKGTDKIETAWEPLWHSKEMTLLKVDLLTGKSHQIRSHLASVGHPLAGDVKYGDPVWNRQLRAMGLRRQFLHSWEICFPKKEELGDLSDQLLKAPLPADLLRVLTETGCPLEL